MNRQYACAHAFSVCACAYTCICACVHVCVDAVGGANVSVYVRAHKCVPVRVCIV